LATVSVGTPVLIMSVTSRILPPRPALEIGDGIDAVTATQPLEDIGAETVGLDIIEQPIRRLLRASLVWRSPKSRPTTRSITTRIAWCRCRTRNISTSHAERLARCWRPMSILHLH